MTCMKIRNGFVSNSSSSSFIIKTRTDEKEVYEIFYKIAVANSKRNLTSSEISPFYDDGHTQFYGMNEEEIKKSIDDNVTIIFYDKSFSYEKKKKICDALNYHTLYGFNSNILDTGYIRDVRYSYKKNKRHYVKRLFYSEIKGTSQYIIVVTTDNYIHYDFYNDLKKHFRFKNYNHLG